MSCVNMFYYNNFSLTFNLKKKNFFLVDNGSLLFKKNIIIKTKNIFKKSYLFYLFKFNGNKYYNLNNFELNKFFFSFLKKFIEKNKNFLFISSYNKTILPYYINTYGDYNLLKYKDFFFYSTFLSIDNWGFFLKNFLNRFNISLIFLTENLDFSKFFKSFSNINTLKFSILDNTQKNIYSDFCFFSNKYEIKFHKLFILNYFMSYFFSNHNNNLFVYKKLYFYRLKNIIFKKYLI